MPLQEILTRKSTIESKIMAYRWQIKKNPGSMTQENLDEYMSLKEELRELEDAMYIA